MLLEQKLNFVLDSGIQIQNRNCRNIYDSTNSETGKSAELGRGRRMDIEDVLPESLSASKDPPPRFPLSHLEFCVGNKYSSKNPQTLQEASASLPGRQQQGRQVCEDRE